jgi:DNA-binding NarL/FixJ family response regulator
MAPDLMQLLTTAVDLVHAGEALPSENITIGDRTFRLITERHKKHGWILLLMEEPARSPCDYTIMTRYGLTEREIQVARLLVERCSNQEIADALGVTTSTAARHTEHVMRKLGVESRREVRGKLQDSVTTN